MAKSDSPNRDVPRRRRPREKRPAQHPSLEPFAKRLEAFRLKAGTTQRSLAKQAGICTNHYQGIAHARANPTLTVVLALANAIGVPPGELLVDYDLFAIPAS